MHDPYTAFATVPQHALKGPIGTALMIGRGEPGAEKLLRQSHASVVACGPNMLESGVLDRVLPATVAFPLMSKGFDATQIVARLAQLGYRGRAMIFAPRLPNREMVLHELRAQAPRMTIQLIERQSD